MHLHHYFICYQHLTVYYLLPAQNRDQFIHGFINTLLSALLIFCTLNVLKNLMIGLYVVRYMFCASHMYKTVHISKFISVSIPVSISICIIQLVGLNKTPKFRKVLIKRGNLMKQSVPEHKMDQHLTLKLCLVLCPWLCFSKGFNFGNARYMLIELKNENPRAVGISPENNNIAAFRMGKHKRNTDNIRKGGFRVKMLPAIVDSSGDTNPTGNMLP